MNKPRIYKVKGTMTFTDGVLNGTLKVKASNVDAAMLEAERKLRVIWPNHLAFKITAVK